RRISSGDRLSIREPESRISPPAMRPGGSISPIAASPVTDLPAPDSPTTPSTSPLAMSKETPSMARSVPRRGTDSTCRVRTARTGTGTAGYARKGRERSSQFRIERIAQPVAQQVDGEDQAGERNAGEGDDPPFAGEQIVVADADQRAERGHGLGHAGTEERQRRLGEDGERQVDGRNHK